MAQCGYFRMPAEEIGATVIFIPQFTRGLAVLEIALWGKQHGFGEIAYVPIRANKEQVAHAAP